MAEEAIMMTDTAHVRAYSCAPLMRTALQVSVKPLIAAFCTAFLGALATPARADTAGCTVVLCLANPAGWTAIDECLAPVRSYFRSIRRRFRPPQCAEAGATFSFATRVTGMRTDAFGVERPVTTRVLVMRRTDGTNEEFGGF